MPSRACATPGPRRIMANHACHHQHRRQPGRLQHGSLAVHWYGIFYVVAFAVAYYLGARAHLLPRGISEGTLERLTGWTILFGLIGARLYYDVQNLDLTSEFDPPLDRGRPGCPPQAAGPGQGPRANRWHRSEAAPGWAGRWSVSSPPRSGSTPTLVTYIIDIFRVASLKYASWDG
jgi:hypothetical protein